MSQHREERPAHRAAPDAHAEEPVDDGKPVPARLDESSRMPEDHRGRREGTPHEAEREPLWFKLADRGAVLATRADGVEAAQQLHRLYAGQPTIILDFEGVQAASIPFLSQLLSEVSEIVRRTRDSGG